MSTKPLVSVIIPAFNVQELIAETLDSILAQTYENFEVIVVDDGSTDRTSLIVHGYGSRILYYYQSNSGGGAVPRNTGIMHSSGDFLCFMDADDLMAPDRIACQIDFMEHYPHVGLVFCDYRNFNREGLYPDSHFQTCPRLWSQLRDKNDLVLEAACAHLTQENFGIAGSLLIRKSVLTLEPGFEQALTACEDFHFYYRLARHTPVGVINEVGMLRRLHGNNMSGSPVRMLSDGIRSRTLLRDSEQDPQARTQLNRYIAECRNSLACHYADHGYYILALQNAWQALSSYFGFRQVLAFCRNVARTILIAIGVHRP